MLRCLSSRTLGVGGVRGFAAKAKSKTASAESGGEARAIGFIKKVGLQILNFIA